MIKGLISVLKKTIKGQETWHLLYRVTLEQMNYGGGGDFDKSGELGVLKYVRTRFKDQRPITIFDAGANIGDYAKEVAQFFGDDALIHSFEPSAKAFEQLKANTSDIKNIRVSNFGLSDSEKEQLLYSDYEGSVWGSLYKRNLEEYRMSLETTETIRLSTVDSYCKVNNIERIHFLKIDVEGSEFDVLKGAQYMLDNKKIDIIQFEFSSANVDSRTFFRDFYYLLKDNYNIFRILKDGLHDLEDYQQNYEVFLTTNYLAVRKF